MTGFGADGTLGVTKRTADFYVSPSGEVIPGAYESYIGENQRSRVTESIEDDEIRAWVAEAYLPTSVIGDGSLADYIGFAKETGAVKYDCSMMTRAWYVTNHLELTLFGASISKSDRHAAERVYDRLLQMNGG